EVTLKSTSGNWCAVSYKGKSGYVKKGYFTSDTTETYVLEKTAYNVKIRSSRSTTADNIVTIVSKGNTVHVYKEMTGGWYYVTYGSYKGFMKAGYFESDKTSTTPSTTKTTTANVNMRTGASKSYSVITVIPSGTKVTVLSTSNGWSKVTYNGNTGYVSSQYLA
ncbi:MAG: SH3 domain-containing protein, partial [Lachnospiraceae bacterium]|nr:SH3 domain-containing protein [Lachnospiraceae bacterium]